MKFCSLWTLKIILNYILGRKFSLLIVCLNVICTYYTCSVYRR